MEFRPQSQWQIHDTVGRRKYANGAERARFLAAADRAEPEVRALAYLLTYAGCRISEALALTIQSVQADTGIVTFRTLKRRRPSFRSVPIPSRVTAMLLELNRGTDDLIWPMHRSTAWRHIKRLFVNARIVGPMTCCRGLRHGFGIHAATTYVPPNLIQRWMGHSLASTTAIYLDAVGEEERRFAERMW